MNPEIHPEILAYHGTDRAFTRFDSVHIRAYNLGLHFGTRAAAEARLNYLREKGANEESFRILTCRLTLKNPLRVPDIFGHSYAQVFDVLETLEVPAAIRAKIAALEEKWMMVDDNPRYQDPARYQAFNIRLNRAFIRIFKSLGYDGFVYTNELEDGEACADSYCVFDARQVKILSCSSCVVNCAA